jgi:hypothetical protein
VALRRSFRWKRWKKLASSTNSRRRLEAHLHVSGVENQMLPVVSCVVGLKPALTTIALKRRYLKVLKLKPSLVLEIKLVRFGLRPNNHLTYIKLIGAHSNLRFQIIKYKNSSKIVKCMINIFIHNNLVS